MNLKILVLVICPKNTKNHKLNIIFQNYLTVFLLEYKKVSNKKFYPVY